MYSLLRHERRCIYCAFRARCQALRSLRLKQHSTRRLFHSTTTFAQDDGIHRLLQGAKGAKEVNRDRNSEQNGVEGILRKIQSKKDLTGLNSDRARKDKHGRGLIRKTNSYVGGAEDFAQKMESRLHYVKEDVRHAPLLKQLEKEKMQAYDKIESFDEIWEKFVSKLQSRPKKLPFLGQATDDAHEQMMASIYNAWSSRGLNGLDDRLKYAFYSYLISPRFTPTDVTNQRNLADLRYPSEWFPGTRRSPRTIHLHVGPTNSGKTYHALQRLEQAESGIYAGPLRLLAHEVYSRMNAKGRKCALITGEERRVPESLDTEQGFMSACTVEMIPLNRKIDVAVIDEIQMIGNAERGWAWTQAFLGAQAKEVHLCGEDRTVPLVQEICASLGEELHIHRYQRLSPLEVASESLNGKLSDLRKGDCIVSFSVMGIHALRTQIERATGRKVATVYGSLPPETRAQQARLFNDPDNEYDYLVASDAVGMGLNLAIKRIIFEASNKFDGYKRRTLSVADIKQIAGRAGRYRVASHHAVEDQKHEDPEGLAQEELAVAKHEESPAPVSDDPVPENTEASSTPEVDLKEETKGLVTTLEKFDFPIVRAAMSATPDQIRTAGLFPPAPVLERFASYFPPGTPFSYMLTRLHELSQMHPRFHLCGLKDQVWIADLIEPVTGLTIADRNIIVSCPASMSDKDIWVKLMPALARCIAEQTGGAIYDIEEMPLEVLQLELSASRGYLRELEQLHKGIVAYLWLSYRFAGVFYTRGLAFHVKSLVEAKIEEVLSKFSFTEAARRRVTAAREKQLLDELAAANEEHEGQEVPSAVETAESNGDAEESERPAEVVLQEQTTLTSGGDHFGGEEDIGFEEPIEDEEARRETAGTFAQWRQQETRPMKDDTISSAVAQGKKEAFEASLRDEVNVVSNERPSVEDSVPEHMDVNHSVPEQDRALSPEQDPSNIEASITPETEMDSNRPPLETQQAPPKPNEHPAKGEETPQNPGGFKQFGAGVPPKHLAQVDIDAKQPERDWSSRP